MNLTKHLKGSKTLKLGPSLVKDNFVSRTIFWLACRVLFTHAWRSGKAVFSWRQREHSIWP
jgi:hypothetical protein